MGGSWGVRTSTLGVVSSIENLVVKGGDADDEL